VSIVKKMGVKGLEKNSKGYRGLEIDTEGGQGPAQTVEQLEKKKHGE
jgi:hypothetical protein